MDRNINTCNICKIRAYIKCEQCTEPFYFCSRGHLYTHKTKFHRASSASNLHVNTQKEIPFQSKMSTRHHQQQQQPPVDMKKLFEHLQSMRQEIINKMANRQYQEAIDLSNKCLSLSRKFYQEDDPFVFIPLFNSHLS